MTGSVLSGKDPREAAAGLPARLGPFYIHFGKAPQQARLPPPQVISFLRKKDGFIGLVLKHIDASAMMDYLLRLISCVEPAPLRQEVLNVSLPPGAGATLREADSHWPLIR